jgi:hypothetical protein
MSGHIVDDGLGDPLSHDGLNPTRALILATYYTLRRTRPPEEVGTAEILGWIQVHEPKVTLPSAALVQLTLTQAKVPHRAPGRPSVTASSPLFSAVRSSPPKPSSNR